MWISLRVLLLLSSLFVYSHASGYNGYKIYDVTPFTAQASRMLFELSQQDQLYDFFTLSRLPNQTARVMVEPRAQQTFLNLLQQHKIPYKVINQNVGKTVREQLQQNQLLRNSASKNGRGLSTEYYHTHDEINNYITELAARFPTRVFVKAFGRSYEGRTMKTITITNGDGRVGKNVILMDGGFHANEWISPAAVIYAIEQLVEKFEENKDLLLDYDWVVLPVVNPDGYEYTQISEETRLWRKTRQPASETCIGIDPNRNFDFHWNGDGASSDPCSNMYAGPKPFSEPEVVVVRDLINTYSDRGIMYLTVHTYGNFILYPWGWSTDLPDTWEDLHEVAKAGADAMYDATGSIYTVGSSTLVFSIGAGASDDYGFNAGFPISYTMELTGEGPNGFDPPPSFINPFVTEAWIGIRAMAKKCVEKYPLING